MCELCWHILNLSGKTCFGECKGNYKKANKLLREYLSISKYHCKICNSNLDYVKMFSNQHNENCQKEIIQKENIIKNIEIEEEKITRLQSDVNCLKTKYKLYHRYNYNKLVKMSVDELRQILMSFNLSIDKKMELYYACTEGNLETFKNLVLKKKYPILEEISYKDYFW